MASLASVEVGGRGGLEEVFGNGRSGKDVEGGEERVNEADLLVGDEGEN